MTKVELEDRITKLQEQHVELVNVRDALKKDLAEARKKYEDALKEVAAARQEVAYASENLGRALGYIDRIHDQEPAQIVKEPFVPPYQQVSERPRGPRLREIPAPDPYASMRNYR